MRVKILVLALLFAGCKRTTSTSPEPKRPAELETKRTWFTFDWRPGLKAENDKFRIELLRFGIIERTRENIRKERHVDDEDIECGDDGYFIAEYKLVIGNMKLEDETSRGNGWAVQSSVYSTVFIELEYCGESMSEAFYECTEICNDWLPDDVEDSYFYQFPFKIPEVIKDGTFDVIFTVTAKEDETRIVFKALSVPEEHRRLRDRE